MLTKINHSISQEMLVEAQHQLPNIDFKITLNKPKRDFFYDPWVINDCYLNTIWEKILNTLPYQIGEARLIKLETTQCYTSHCDIDDRYHLNIIGNNAYLIDLESKKMYATFPDLNWYYMDAGLLHSAVNFNDTARYQLVVRKLLNNNQLENTIHIRITTTVDKPNHRFMFDQTVSKWLNKANKFGIINKFSCSESIVDFDMNSNYLLELQDILPKQFELRS